MYKYVIMVVTLFKIHLDMFERVFIITELNSITEHIELNTNNCKWKLHQTPRISNKITVDF